MITCFICYKHCVGQTRSSQARTIEYHKYVIKNTNTFLHNDSHLANHGLETMRIEILENVVTTNSLHHRDSFNEYCISLQPK